MFLQNITAFLLHIEVKIIWERFSQSIKKVCKLIICQAETKTINLFETEQAFPSIS